MKRVNAPEFEYEKAVDTGTEDEDPWQDTDCDLYNNVF